MSDCYDVDNRTSYTQLDNTRDYMVKQIEQLKDEMEIYRAEIQRLKARIFDLEHDDD